MRKIISIILVGAIGIIGFTASAQKSNKPQATNTQKSVKPVQSKEVSPKETAPVTPKTQLARTAIEQYDFSEVARLLNGYKAPNDSLEAIADELRKMASTGEQMLERIEGIVVFDSINVPRKRFFEAYRLSPKGGIFVDNIYNRNNVTYANDPIFLTTDSLRGFAGVDGRIATFRNLTDGTTDSLRYFPNAEGIYESSYPYIMADGMEMYFAAKGDESLGGYDIYITRRSEMDGEFLPPQNLGMPYNSPWDDYLLVIDEGTGIGWWASERNQLADSVTIYMFMPQELRNNLSEDDELLIEKARLSNIALTVPEGFVKPDIEGMIAKITPEPAFVPGLEFALPGGRVISNPNQLSNGRSRELMEEYLEQKADIEYDRNHLAELRALYGSGDKTVADEIIKLERSIPQAELELQRIVNELVKSEE